MRKVKIIDSFKWEDLSASVEKFLENPYVDLIDVKITTENRVYEGKYGNNRVTRSIACIIYENTEYVELNGLAWFVNNCNLPIKSESLDGYTYTSDIKELFIYSDLKGLQESNNGRLPTVDEFSALFGLNHIWDNKRMGLWFANEKKDLMTNKSLFLNINSYKLVSRDKTVLDKTAFYHTSSEDEEGFEVLDINEKECKSKKIFNSDCEVSDNYFWNGLQDRRFKAFVRLVRDL